MIVKGRFMFTDVYEGKRRLYVTALDMSNGGQLRLNFADSDDVDLPLMVPLEFEATVKPRVFNGNLALDVVSVLSPLSSQFSSQ